MDDPTMDGGLVVPSRAEPTTTELRHVIERHLAVSIGTMAETAQVTDRRPALRQAMREGTTSI